MSRSTLRLALSLAAAALTIQIGSSDKLMS